MSNFIFKSQWTFKKINNQLNLILSELRHQRSEHSIILRQLNLILNQKELVDQASSYYKKYGEEESEVLHPDDEKDLD